MKKVCSDYTYIHQNIYMLYNSKCIREQKQNKGKTYNTKK